MRLRNQLIRLAHSKPELRSKILPLLASMKVAYSLNAGSVPLDKAREYAASLFKKPVEEVLPDFDKNYKRLQKAVKAALGTPRIQMPVIEPSDIKVFQDRLNQGRVDIFKPFAKGKFVFPKEITNQDGQWVELGWTDNDKKDDVVKAQIKGIEVGKLKPTQNQIWLEKTFGMIAQYGPPKSGSPVLKTTVIVSSDGYILDGHHRYSQAMMSDPKLKMKALFVPLKIKTLLEVGRAYGEAIGNKPKQGNQRTAGVTLSVNYKPGNPPVLDVNGKSFVRVSDLVDVVERVLRRKPDTIVMGPKMSIGPNQTAVGYSEAPYAFKDSRGNNKDTGYDPAHLWDKHWDKVLSWGNYAGRNASLRSKVIRLAHSNPELRSHLLSLLR